MYFLGGIMRKSPEVGSQLDFNEFTKPESTRGPLEQKPIQAPVANEPKKKPDFDPFGREGGHEDKRYL